MRQVGAGPPQSLWDALSGLAVEIGDLRQLGAEAREGVQQLLHVLPRRRLVERDANAPGSHPAQVDAGLARLGEQHLAAPRHRQRQGIEKAVVFDGDAEPREAGGQDTAQELNAEGDARETVGATENAWGWGR